MTKPKPTKAEVRKWMKRVREDMKDMEHALKQNDWDFVKEMAMDASGAAAEILTLLEEDDE